MKTHAQLVEIAQTLVSQVNASYPGTGVITITFNQAPHTPVAVYGSAPTAQYAARLLREIADRWEKQGSSALIV